MRHTGKTDSLHQSWASSAVQTVRRIIHKIYRTGLPEMLGGSVMLYSAFVTKDKESALGGAWLALNGLNRGCHTLAAMKRLQRIRHVSGLNYLGIG